MYAEYTHEHLLILHSNDILKFPTFQNIELQALVNAFLYVVIKAKWLYRRKDTTIFARLQI